MKKFAVFLICSIAANCFAGEKPWMSGPSKRLDVNKGKILEAEKVSEVVHSRVSTALEYLSKAETVEISEELCHFLTGKEWSIAQGEHFYLVRAIFGNGGTGGYQVYLSQSRKEVVISHGSLGRSDPQPTSSALILQLRQPPKRIYSLVSVDQ